MGNTIVKMLRKALILIALQIYSGACSVFSILPMEGTGTNEKPPELKRVRGINMLRFLHTHFSCFAWIFPVV